MPAEQHEAVRPIVVTGSRIPRTNLTAVSPVTVVSQEEIKLEGATSAEEILNQLPQVAPAQGAFISGGATGTSTVDLRNLGASRTLVLINGRRMGPGDPRSPVPDLNLIPTALIQRVEVLTGGATSVYGSDAISGVVNFILETKLDGVRVDGQASVFQHDNRNGSGLREALIARGFDFPSGNTVDGARKDIDIAFGESFLDSRAHLTLYAGYREVDELTQDKRDHSACAAAANPLDLSMLVCRGRDISARTSFPGNFLTGVGQFTIGPNGTFVPGSTLFNFGPWSYFQRPDRRWTAGGFAQAEISPAAVPYFELMYLDDRSVAQVAPSGNFGDTAIINCDNPLLSDQQRSVICVEDNLVLDDAGQPTDFAHLVVFRRNVEGGGRSDDLRHKTLRLLGGSKGDLGRGWSYDVSYLYQRAKMRDAHLNDFSISRLRRALNVVADPSTGEAVCRSVLTGVDPACVPWDIFTLGRVTPEALAYLSVPSLVRGAVTQQVANANATVDLGKWGFRSTWAEDSPALNFGAEYRRDKLEYEPDELAQSGDLVGVLPTLPVHGSTQVRELFAEARIPLISGRLIESLAIEGGYRHSRYKAGDASFTTNAYKLALDVAVVPGLRFRASRQRAVRAPNIVELFDPPVLSIFFHDPCEGPSPQASLEECARTGVTAEQYGAIVPNEPFAPFRAIAGGNRELRPETATTHALGMVLQPRVLRGLNVTVDWWDIALKNAVEGLSGDAIIDACVRSGDPTLCNRIHRSAEGSLWMAPGHIDTSLLNIGSVKARGVDVGASYRREIGHFGSATIDFLGSYLDRFVIDNSSFLTPEECAGKIGVVCLDPTPRWRHKARATWDGLRGISMSLQWRHVAGMRSKPAPEFPPPGPLTERVPARNYFDLTGSFRVRRSFTFRIGVNNVFDREPPLVPLGPGVGDAAWNGNTYPQWYDPLGRFIFVGATMNY